jgi:hypothetical protein
MPIITAFFVIFVCKYGIKLNLMTTASPPSPEKNPMAASHLVDSDLGSAIISIMDIVHSVTSRANIALKAPLFFRTIDLVYIIAYCIAPAACQLLHTELFCLFKIHCL